MNEEDFNGCFSEMKMYISIEFSILIVRLQKESNIHKMSDIAKHSQLNIENYFKVIEQRGKKNGRL